VRDEDGDDQQFVPEEMDLQLRLPAGATGRVPVAGRTTCGGRAPGQLSSKNSQRIALADGSSVDVDLGGLIEFVCPR
jgi:hypothetical protein